MPASVLTMPEATRAASMYEEGYSHPEIARALGRSRKAVRTGLRQIGVQPRTSTEGLRMWHRKHSTDHNARPQAQATKEQIK